MSERLYYGSFLDAPNFLSKLMEFLFCCCIRDLSRSLIVCSTGWTVLKISLWLTFCIENIDIESLLLFRECLLTTGPNMN